MAKKSKTYKPTAADKTWDKLRGLGFARSAATRARSFLDAPPRPAKVRRGGTIPKGLVLPTQRQVEALFKRDTGVGFGAFREKLKAKAEGKRKKVRGNTPSRFLVSSETQTVSKTGSLTAAREDKERARRHGIKGLRIVDTKLGKDVRGTGKKK